MLPPCRQESSELRLLGTVHSFRLQLCLFSLSTRETPSSFNLRVLFISSMSGAYFALPYNSTGQRLFWGMVTLLSSYWFILIKRNFRRLPPGLSKMKFVTLAHLKSMLRHNQSICRFQELPSTAFGNSQKSSYLIVTSHRWLNRYTCDVPSNDCPNGVRLTGMAEQLESIFSLTSLSALFSMRRGQGCLIRPLRA